MRVTLNADWDACCVPRMGVAALTRMAFEGQDLRPLWHQLMDKATDDAAGSGMGMDLSVIAQLLGDKETGLAIQRDTLALQQLYRSPCAAARPRLKVLALAAVMDIGGNTPLEFLLADSDIALATFYAVPGMPLPTLPDHDIAIVVAPDGDAASPSLAAIDVLAKAWPRPLLNRPEAIRVLDRDRLYRALHGIAGLEIPPTVRAVRDDLLKRTNEDFPLIIRPIGSHAGFGLARLEDRGALAHYLSERKEDEFFLSPFVDYASPDGMFRKYRIVLVNGKAHACHMAIADEWKVWYLNADMAVSVPNRLEEAAFMREFDSGFAARHEAALGEMGARIGLDYVAIDCAETKDGKLLVFEADNTAIVHDMDPPSVYPYKSAQMQKIFHAVQAMLFFPRQTSDERGMKEPQSADPAGSLDPEDWTPLRAEAHRMLDDMLDFLSDLRAGPVWQPMPEEVRAHLRGQIPAAPASLEAVHEEFKKYILPYGGGNVHPGFMGWVQGGGTAVGMIAEMLAAGLNANLGGRHQAPIEVERQITGWVRELFGFPETANGLFVTGTSIANFIAVLVARSDRLGPAVRKEGLGPRGAKLRAYATPAAHRCVVQAIEMAGLGSNALRLVPVDGLSRMEMGALARMVAEDKTAGLEPFLVVGSAGTVDVGAIDDLDAIARFCAAEKLWFHIDGAYGALGMLSPEVAPKLRGLEKADSVAFDFHKWGQVPYDAGFILVRDGAKQMETFASPAAYLKRETRGLAAGSPWPCDLGPDLSRGFRALKTWFTLKVIGRDALGASITAACELARTLEARIRAEPALELMAPAQLNIVCFRYRADDPDRVNADIAADIQISGIAAPSTTSINGALCIRTALFNHRTRREDVDALVDAALRFGKARTGV